MRSLILLLFFLKSLLLEAQIDFLFDTAQVKAIRFKYEYASGGKFGVEERIRNIFEYDHNGKPIKHWSFVNRTDTAEFMNEMTYDDSGRILKREEKFRSDENKVYEVSAVTNYYYTDNKLTRIREYEYGNLTGDAIYSYSATGKQAHLIYYKGDTLTPWIEHRTFYDVKGRPFKHINRMDTGYYYYDHLGHDSVYYSVSSGKPNSMTIYKYKNEKKREEYYRSLIFKGSEIKRIYRYKKRKTVTRSCYKKFMDYSKVVTKRYYDKAGLLYKTTQKTKGIKPSANEYEVTRFTYEFW
jgi:hypothetical protein